MTDDNASATEGTWPTLRGPVGPAIGGPSRRTMAGMTLDEYQRGALTTASFPASARLLYPALKLAGEAGEVAEKVGKLMRDEGWTPGTELSDTQRDALSKELGDVLWYVAVLASDLGVALETVASTNLAKLASRKERGVIGGSGDER